MLLKLVIEKIYTANHRMMRTESYLAMAAMALCKL
jgi:hypothetical protein